MTLYEGGFVSQPLMPEHTMACPRCHETAVSIHPDGYRFGQCQGCGADVGLLLPEATLVEYAHAHTDPIPGFRDAYRLDRCGGTFREDPISGETWTDRSKPCEQTHINNRPIHHVQRTVTYSTWAPVPHTADTPEGL